MSTPDTLRSPRLFSRSSRTSASGATGGGLRLDSQVVGRGRHLDPEIRRISRTTEADQHHWPRPTARWTAATASESSRSWITTRPPSAPTALLRFRAHVFSHTTRIPVVFGRSSLAASVMSSLLSSHHLTAHLSEAIGDRRLSVDQLDHRDSRHHPCSPGEGRRSRRSLGRRDRPAPSLSPHRTTSLEFEQGELDRPSSRIIGNHLHCHELGRLPEAKASVVAASRSRLRRANRPRVGRRPGAGGSTRPCGPLDHVTIEP